MNLNGIQHLIFRHSCDQTILQAYVVLLLHCLLIHTLWNLLVLNLEIQKFVCPSKKAYLTSSFLLDGRTDPGRSVAYRTTHVFEFCRRLILERGRQKF